MRHLTSILAIPLTLSATALLPGVVQAFPASLAAQPSEDPVERLSEWPKLESKTGTSKEITRLRKARTEEMGSEAAENLIEVGAGAVPLLLRALDKEKKEDARERVVAVLDRLCGPAHTRLLAAEFEHDSTRVRCWALGQVARTPDAGVREAAEAAFARIDALDDPDAEERAEHLAAARCVTSAGSLVGLEALRDAALADWATHGEAIRTCLEAVRGPEASERFWNELHEGDRKHRIATVRMLAGCGNKERARDLIPLLDDSDNTIRVAAINALRGIVDGEPPLKKLATFAAIEKALEWKKRL